MLAVAATLVVGVARAGESYGIGRNATPQEIAGWDIDASPSGVGLPPGRGDVRQGGAIFADKCASCHGARGEGKPMDRLVGGADTLRDKKPEKTVGSFWPYATTLFDYVRRAMPLNAPQSLTPDQVYAVSAYVLFLNGIVPQDTALIRIVWPKSACGTATASSAFIRCRRLGPNPSRRQRSCRRKMSCRE
jgi:cytochrome c